MKGMMLTRVAGDGPRPKQRAAEVHHHRRRCAFFEVMRRRRVFSLSRRINTLNQGVGQLGGFERQ
jgi:hypothetical protein